MSLRSSSMCDFGLCSGESIVDGEREEKKKRRKKGGTEEGEGEEGRKESRKRVSGGTPVWNRVTGDGRALTFRPWLIRCDPDVFLFLSRINAVDNRTKISYSTRTYRLPE